MDYIFLLILILGISIFFNYKLYYKTKEITQLNLNTVETNNELEQSIKNKKLELNNILNLIQAQNNILSSITKSIKENKESAKEQAMIYYTTNLNDLRREYQEAYSDLDEQLQLKRKELSKENQNLQILKEKQHSYNIAIQRQEAIDKNIDYFRLIINPLDLNDIVLLRNLQKNFTKKDIIDKLIWDYYKPAYDILMTHISKKPSTQKICGIYRITDISTNQSYIGQSIDCRERFRQHIKNGLSHERVTNKLYQAMQLTGPENFIFEILEEVQQSQLNEREAYWIDFYETKTFGLNSKKGNK